MFLASAFDILGRVFDVELLNFYTVIYFNICLDLDLNIALGLELKVFCCVLNTYLRSSDVSQ